MSHINVAVGLYAAGVGRAADTTWSVDDSYAPGVDIPDGVACANGVAYATGVVGAPDATPPARAAADSPVTGAPSVALIGDNLVAGEALAIGTDAEGACADGVAVAPGTLMHLLPLVSHINVAAGGVDAAGDVGAAGAACAIGVVPAARKLYGPGGNVGVGIPVAAGDLKGEAVSDVPEARVTEDQATSTTNVSTKPTRGRIDLGIPAHHQPFHMSILRTLGPIVNY